MGHIIVNAAQMYKSSFTINRLLHLEYNPLILFWRTSMPAVHFDKFYKYDELTTILTAWVTEQPDRLKLVSIGTSGFGRLLWMVVL